MATPDSMNVFDEMDIYWAEIADKNQTERQIQLLKNSLKRDGYILDLACGTGRHSVALSAEGYDMVGLDVSANLLTIARQHFSSVHMVRGDMRFFPFKNQAFSAAVSMDTSFGYLTSEQDDAVSLAEARRVLRQDSVFVVDVFNREHLMRKYGQSRILKRLRWAALPFLLKLHSRRILFRFFKWIEYPSFFLLQKRTVAKNGERLYDVWVVYDKASGHMKVFDHIVRLYALGLLQGLLENAGFVISEVYGDYERGRLSTDSSRLIVLASVKQ